MYSAWENDTRVSFFAPLYQVNWWWWWWWWTLKPDWKDIYIENKAFVLIKTLLKHTYIVLKITTRECKIFTTTRGAWEIFSLYVNVDVRPSGYMFYHCLLLVEIFLLSKCNLATKLWGFLFTLSIVWIIHHLRNIFSLLQLGWAWTFLAK